MPKRVPERNKGAVTALRRAGVPAKTAAKVAGVSEKTAKRAGGPTGAIAGTSLRVPLAGAASSARALEDLEELRDVLLARVRGGDVSPRDLAALSAEIRKIDTSITQLELLSRADDDGEPEEVRDAAARVRAKLEKMAKPATPMADKDSQEPLARVAG